MTASARRGGWTATAARRIAHRAARRAGINKPVGPHTLRHAFITAALDARMTDIAAEAGVAVQTVYFTFHTKAELLQACY